MELRPPEPDLTDGVVTLRQLALSDIALSFTAAVGQTSRAQTVTLTNTGTAALALSSITVRDTSFAMTSTCGSTLAPSASCTTPSSPDKAERTSPSSMR